MIVNLSNEQKEKVKGYYHKINLILQESSGEHKKIIEICQALFQIIPEDKFVVETLLTALIKCK
jgi:hypothetical protein